MLANFITEYHAKNRLLSAHYVEVGAKEFYRGLFPVGTFERAGVTEDEKPNGLALEIQGKGKAYHHIITDDLPIEALLKKEFVIMSAISYFGRSRSGKNARYIYALTFDIDGVKENNLKDLIYQVKNNVIPRPTFIVNSGGGIHLYYQFKNPLPMYPRNQEYLRKLKHCLTKIIWNDYTSDREDIEYQSILQGFRMVGSPTKMGNSYIVRAYKTGEKIDIEYLFSFLRNTDKKELGLLKEYRKAKVTKEEAQILYPEWYQAKVIEKKNSARWHIKKDLYYWWLNRIKTEIQLHHRYFAIMSLAIYAKKCDIEENELRKDAYSLLEVFDKLTVSEDNHFTVDDIEAALSMYNEDYVTFPRDNIARVTNLYIKQNKRNGRKQAVHMQIMRATRDILYPNGEWRNVAGRPTKEIEIRNYMHAHPDATKSDIKKELNISYDTIRKYYDKIKAEL